jgi:gluconate 2-dehydrogenase gamma chain
MTEISRRGFIATAGGALAAAWLMADPAKLAATGMYASKVRGAPQGTPFQFLTAAQAADIEAATAQIIPSDGTPGAREARVVHFIDRALATWQKDQRPVFAKGAAELTARAKKAQRGVASFAALTDAQQRDVIASLEKDKHEFFNALRSATIVGMLSNPDYGGNYDKTGWKMIGFNDQFAWGPPFGWYDANER